MPTYRVCPPSDGRPDRPWSTSRAAAPGAGPFRRAPSAFGRTRHGGGDPSRRRRPDALDDAVARCLPDPRRGGLRVAFRRRRRHRVRRLLPRRHRCDGRPQRPGGRRGDHPPGVARADDHAAVGGRRLGRRGTGPPVHAAEVAAGDDGDRRQPVRPALRPSPHRSAEGGGDGLVLPRNGRRDAGDPERPRPGRQPSGRHRPADRPGPDDPGRAVQRPRRARTGAGPRRRRGRADGAGADEHRHRPARARLSRRGSTSSPARTARGS